ncbi:MAG: hypothetical protein ABFD79_16355 [Phycisphaerales bacterium]
MMAGLNIYSRGLTKEAKGDIIVFLNLNKAMRQDVNPEFTGSNSSLL